MLFRSNAELFANLASEAIIDLTMPRHRNLGAITGIGEYRVAAAFPLQTASMTTQVFKQLVPLHL